MKKFLNEFKAFALKGNVMDMAVGVLIGSAFGGIVTSFTDNFINPLISLIGGTEVNGEWVIRKGVLDPETMEYVGRVSIGWGAFLTAIINFIIMAFCIFLMVKAVNKLMNAGKKKEAPAAPTTKKCPFCQSEISIVATKCAFCTSAIPAEEVEAK